MKAFMEVVKEFGNLPGTHSEYIRVPYGDVNLVTVPDGLESEQVLFVGDILPAGYFAAEKGNIGPSDNVVIYGAGPVGLCAVQSARLFNPNSITLVDINPFRLEVGIIEKGIELFGKRQDHVIKIVVRP